jgi:hypothetical protein
MDLKYNKSTDSQHKIKLESSLVYAAWRSGLAPLGQSAPVEVFTSFVGDGAKIKIKGKSQKGKNLGKIDSVIKNNKFVGMLDIPDNLEIGDAVQFEVELPQNGLSGRSGFIPVGPPIEATDLKWSVQEARRGDIVTLSAKVTGLPDGSEAKIVIYEYDADNIHDRITALPTVVQKNKIELLWEYEYHEDTDEIPTDEELKKYGKNYNHPEYFFVIEIMGRKFGQKQESGLLKFKDWIEIILEDEDGKRVANEQYVLHLPDGQQKQGALDGDGYSREEKIPPGKVKIEFPNSGTINIIG